MTNDDAHRTSHGAGVGHGNARDKELKAVVRYLKIAPRMWRSPVNDAVVDLVSPTAGETVVDVGAGMGPAIIRAAKRGAIVVAVEPTPFLRGVLTARCKLSRYRSNISVRDGGAEALPLGDGQAHAVWALNTMHHWISVEEGAVEIARVLAPGGRIVLVDENFADPTHPNNPEWSARHDGETHHGFSMVDAAAMGELMAAAGLVNVAANERSLAGRPTIAVMAQGPK